MSNPFQHAFGAQDHTNFYNAISGHSNRGTRRSSYGTAHNASRANAFSNLQNPILENYAGPPGGPYSSHSHNPYPGASSYRNHHDHDHVLNGSVPETSTSRPWATRDTPLAPSSRAFSFYLGAVPSPDPDLQQSSELTVPSYLRGTVYAERLEEQHKAELEALRDGRDISSVQAPSTSNGVNNGATFTSTSTSTSNQNGKTPTSHRGVAYNVTERNAPVPEDPPVGDLPARWNRGDKAAALEICTDGLEAKYVVSRTSSERDHEAGAVRADKPVPPSCGVFYYEILILSKKREETTIGLGFASKKASIHRLPGWEAESWGYHGDDGNAFAAQNTGRTYGPRFTTGDTVGCGINFNNGSIFFTKNGVNLGVAFRDVRPASTLELYPTVGLKKTSEHLRVNFGQSPFVFDIDTHMQEQKDKIWSSIRNTRADNLVPGLDETELVQSLVLQFLQHDGYVETARAFAQEMHSEKKALNLDPNVEVAGPSLRDDEDATDRQAIRRSVLEGNIDKALELTNTYYPNVLADNQQVYFRLRCRKFIEMVRRSAELGMRRDAATKGPLSQSHLDRHMEIDDNYDDDGEEEEEEGEVEDDGHVYDSDIDGAGSGLSNDPEVLLQDMIEYGKTLQVEFAGDPENTKALQEAFALIAYENPLKVKDVAHLLDRKGRVAVAEELNSAILTSLGKSRCAELEMVWAQTDVLLERMRPGGDEGAFVSLKDITEQIPKKQPF